MEWMDLHLGTKEDIDAQQAILVAFNAFSPNEQSPHCIGTGPWAQWQEVNERYTL